MTASILVTGGTGTLGRLVVGRLRNNSREVRVLTRRRGLAEDGIRFITGDLGTGAGLEPAVDEARIIVHCASDKKGDADGTRNLVRAASALPTPPHLVYISIVGVDRLSFGYARSKLDSEHIVANSGLPWTILRATQFYDMILSGAKQLAKLPVVPAPAGFEVQPIHPDDVAARLVELALDEPAGRAPDLGGPEKHSFAGLLRRYLRARNRRRPVMPIWLPGLGEIRAGALVPNQPPAPGLIVGCRTWEEFLAEKMITPPGAVARRTT